MKTINDSSPARYARSILKKCGQIKPPICVDTVLDYLGIELQEISDEDIMEYSKARGSLREFSDHLRRECAMLERIKGENPVIRVYKNCHGKRKRLHIFHECAHDILPWHNELNYLCKKTDLSPATHKALEREAFEGGAEFLMPQDIFYDDLTSLPTSIDSIVELSNRYDSSLEATAIRYAQKNPQICAIMIVEPSYRVTRKNKEDCQVNHCQGALELKVPQSTKSVDKVSPLRVKYSVASPKFEKFIKQGTPIARDNPIYESWVSDSPIWDTIDSKVFGSSARYRYRIECMPLGNTGNLLSLIWSQDQTLSLNL